MLHLRYEQMRPQELAAAIRRRPIAFLGVGPLEWHGEHLGFGSDPMRATKIMETAWKRIGGVLLPMLPVGTDGHSKIKGREWWGMEQFAQVPLPGSLFVKEQTFRALMRDMVSALDKTGFRVLVLCTGHQAPNQIKVLKELEAASKRRRLKVLSFWTGRVSYTGSAKSRGGHAGATESSELMAVSSSLASMARAGKLARDRSVGLTPKAFAKGQVSAAHGQARFRAQAEWIRAEVRKLGFR